MATQTSLVGRTVPGVSQALTDRVVDGLNHNLANLTDLSIAYKQAHWNVVGKDFQQLHALFDELTDQTRLYVDEIAERAVALGRPVRGTLQAAARESALPAFPEDERDEVALLQALSDSIEVVASDLRKSMEECSDEPATQDVYIEIIRGIEKQRWMLNAHLG